MSNPNIPRWVMASLTDLFKEVSDDLNLHYFVEGVDEEEPEDFNRNSALFRMNGPDVKLGGGTETHRLELQILLTNLPNVPSENAYEPYRWAGAFQETMLGPLPIYKYGTGPEDDQSLIGCLEPDPNILDYVRIVSYGQIDKTSRVRQLSVNGRFVLQLNL